MTSNRGARLVLTFVIVALLRGARVGAQLSGPIPITAQDAGNCATANACAVFSIGSNLAYAFDVSGTFSGTLTFEVTVEGVVWRAVRVVNVTSGAAATTTTMAGTFSLGNAGYATARLRATAWTSGTATVSMRKGYAVAAPVPAAMGGRLKRDSDEEATWSR